jgi:hypothetical protein
MGEWQVPPAWYNRSLSPEKAHQMILTGNLGVDLIRDRWQALHERYSKGDQYWRYRRPEDGLASPLGWQEGIVLNRGCRQLGFVATSIQVDEEAATTDPDSVGIPSEEEDHRPDRKRGGARQ